MEDIFIDSEIRILVVSVSSWNIKIGMNTWPALLEGHDPDCIAHICFRQDAPNNPICNNYFVISENKVIKSVLKRGLKTGYAVERCEDDAVLSEDLTVQKNRYNKMKKHRNAFTLLGRELLWKLGKWKTKELDSFVKNFHPDIILYGMEGYLYFNRVCRYVKKISGAKSIGFFYDDNFTYKQCSGLSDDIWRFFQRKSLKKLAKTTDDFLAITLKTKKEADAFFKVDCTVVSKPCNNIPTVEDKEPVFPIKILYTGNLGIGRDESLLMVAEALKKVNAYGNHFELNVYSATDLSESIKEKLSCGFCFLHDAVFNDEVLALQKEADILLFLEAVGGRNSKIARLSFSTKITDYFSAGKCIFAVGPKDIAPIEYFEENGCAVIASDEQSITDKLLAISDNLKIITEYAKKAAECALKNHKKEDILNIFNKTIRRVLIKN